jgi:probable O-glycosylation ligase (exosortase A-associated)
MRDVLLLALTGLFTLIALRKPLVGMLVFVGLSILGPHSFTWGIARTFPHSQVVGLATVVGFLLSPEAKNFPREREARLVLALWALVTVSTLFALEPEQAWNQLFFVSKIFLMMFLCTAMVNTPERLHMLVRAIALSLGLLALKTGLFVLLTGFQEKVYGPEDTYLFQENAIGIALSANLPLLVYILRVERARWLRWTIAAMFLFSYPAVVGTFSRGAWLSLGAVSALLVLFSRRRILAIGLVLVLAIGAVTWQSFIVSKRVAARWDTLQNYEEDSSAQSRFWSWEFCRRVGLGRPLGGGFNLYSIAAYRRFYPEFLARWPGKVWVCHSMWMEFLAEHGILGFLLGTGLIVSCLLSARRLSRQAQRQRTDRRVADLAPMLGVAFVGFAIGGTFLDVAYHELFYQLIALVIIAKSLFRQGTRPAVEGDNQVEPRSRTQVTMKPATKRVPSDRGTRVPVAGS